MRIARLKKVLSKKKTFPYLITDLCNIKYLTGFEGSYARLIVGEDYSYFISDSRYEEYARSILPEGVIFVLQKNDYYTALKSAMSMLKSKTVYAESHSLSLSTFLQMKKDMNGIKIIPSDDDVNSIRMVKEPGEIEKIKKAAEMVDACFSHLLKFVKPGMVEWDVSVEIEYFYRKNRCRKSSFDSIVASGAGSSMPHYVTSMKKKIAPGDTLLIDMGCELDGYNSDLTRTIFVGDIDPEIRKIYNIVLRAQKAALDAVKPGVCSGKLDSVARKIIASEGYGGNFGHSLGHGVGLDVHELPALRKKGTVRIKNGMAMTVEPGIYLPGIGGVRIEDMVLATGSGREIITKSSKDIIII